MIRHAATTLESWQRPIKEWQRNLLSRMFSRTDVIPHLKRSINQYNFDCALGEVWLKYWPSLPKAGPKGPLP